MIDSQILANYAADWGNKRTTHANCSSDAVSQAAANECQSLANIDIYYLATAIAHMGATKVLPQKIGRFLEANDTFNVKANIQQEYTSIAVRMNF